MGRWSEPRPSPTVHSALSAKGGWAKDTSGELRPPATRVSNVARLVSVPQRGVVIEVTASEGHAAGVTARTWVGLDIFG